MMPKMCYAPRWAYSRPSLVHHLPHHHRAELPRRRVRAPAVARTECEQQCAGRVRLVIDGGDRRVLVQRHVPGGARARLLGGDLDLQLPLDLRVQDPGAALVVERAERWRRFVGEVPREHLACACGNGRVGTPVSINVIQNPIYIVRLPACRRWDLTNRNKKHR